MFLVAAVIGHLATLIRRQAEAARLHERQTAAMYALSRQLAGTRGVDEILQAAVKQISEIFECQAVALLPDEKGKLRAAAGDLSAVFQKDVVKEMGVAQWAYETGGMAGWGTQNHPDSPILYVPLPATSTTLGVLALRPKDPEAENWLLPEQLRLRLSGILGQTNRPGLGSGRFAKGRLNRPSCRGNRAPADHAPQRGHPRFANAPGGHRRVRQQPVAGPIGAAGGPGDAHQHL